MNAGRHFRFIGFLVLLPALLAAPFPRAAAATPVASRGPAVAAQAAAQWTTSGPYADDATAVAASPAFDTDHIAFLGVSYRINTGQPSEQAIAAVLRSTDGGATWSTAWAHTSPQGTTQAWLTQILVSPAFTADRTVFALWAEPTGGGVVRSTDGGASFQPVNVGTGAFAPTTKTLSISPAYGADHTIAVTADNGNVTTSYLSTDGGTTWGTVTPTIADACGDTLAGGGFLLALGNNTLGSYAPEASAVCSNNLDQMYITSTDGGRTWSFGGDIQAQVSSPAFTNNFDTQHSRLYAAPDGSAIVYTDQYGNLVRSADRGATWQSLIGASSTLGHDNPPDTVQGFGPYYTVQFHTAASVYAIHEWTKLASPRIYHSGDGGATWDVAWQQAGGGTAQHDVADAGAQTLFFAAGNEGLLRSRDLGQTWQPVGSFLPQHPAVALSPNFATDHAVYTVTFSDSLPTTGQDVNGFGIYRSFDGGATWSEPEAPNPAVAAGFGTVFTTSSQGGRSLAVSPAFAADRTVFEGDRIGAVAIARDGGVTWTSALPGTPPQEGWYVNALAVSPNFATDRVVYWGGGPGGFGVFKSVDGGQTWVQVTPLDRINEISASEVHALALSPEPSGVLDVAIGIDKLFLARDDPASTGRQTWLDTGFATAYAVALSPNYQRDCTVYASKWPGPGGIGATLDDGVYVSTNACPGNAGAITWTRLTASLPVRDFATIALSPNFPADHTLFIGSYTSGVYLSTDGGQTWSAFNTGLGNLTVHQLAVAATGAQGGVLFAATDGGVWQTPVPLVPAPFISFSPPGLAFGDQQVGTTSAARTVTVSNGGGAPLAIGAVTLGGAAPAEFGGTTSCAGATLAPGGTCQVTLAFTPAVTGDRSASLIVADNTAGSPHGVLLSGVGIPGPSPSPSPTSGWTPWASQGGILSDSPAAAGLGGRVYVFAKGSDAALYVKSADTAGNFTDWQDLGGILTAAPAAASFDGRLYAFAKGSDNALYVKSSADGVTWTDWSDQGGILLAPPAAASAGGKLFVFAMGTDKALYAKSTADGANWTDWQRLGGILTAAPAAAGFQNRIYAFAKGSDNALYVKSSADGTNWTDWSTLGGTLAAAPAAAATGDGATLYAVVTTPGGVVYERHSADGTNWTPWTSLGGAVVGPPAAASVPGGPLFVFARWVDNALWERFLSP